MQYNWIHCVSNNTAIDQILRLLYKTKRYLRKYSWFWNADIRTAHWKDSNLFFLNAKIKILYQLVKHYAKGKKIK